MALLHDQSRLHFTLESTRASPLDNNQLASGNHFQTEYAVKFAYTVRVKFNSEMEGYFRQRVIFDFGARPVVGRTVSMDVHATTDCHDRVVSLQQQLQQLGRRWTRDNCTIVPFDDAAAGADDLDATLLERYRLPTDFREIVNTEMMSNELNRHNYTHRMHSLLMLEEFRRADIISRSADSSFLL